MLYKVTPMMATPEPTPRAPRQPRKKRRSAVFDHEGHEVLISLMCLKCRQIKPLLQFGLRKMADGAIRNQPWCRTCRSGAGASPKKGEPLAPIAAEATVLQAPGLTEQPALPAVAEPVATFEEAAPEEPAPAAAGCEPEPAALG